MLSTNPEFLQSRVETVTPHLALQISWHDSLISFDELEIVSKSREIWHIGQRPAIRNSSVSQIPAVKFDPLNDWQVQLINLAKGLLTGDQITMLVLRELWKFVNQFFCQCHSPIFYQGQKNVWLDFSIVEAQLFQPIWHSSLFPSELPPWTAKEQLLPPSTTWTTSEWYSWAGVGSGDDHMPKPPLHLLALTPLETTLRASISRFESIPSKAQKIGSNISNCKTHYVFSHHPESYCVRSAISSMRAVPSFHLFSNEVTDRDFSSSSLPAFMAAREKLCISNARDFTRYRYRKWSPIRARSSTSSSKILTPSKSTSELLC